MHLPWPLTTRIARVIITKWLEDLHEVLHDALIKILTAQVSVAVGGHHLKDTVVDGQQGHIKGTLGKQDESWKVVFRCPQKKMQLATLTTLSVVFFWVSWRCHHGINNKLVIWKTIPHYPIQNVWWGQNSVNCPSKFSKETMAPPPRSYTKMFFSVFLSKPHLLFAWKVVEFPENHVVVLVLGRDLQFDSSLLKLMLQYSTIPHSQYHQLHWEVFLLVCIPAYACRF